MNSTAQDTGHSGFMHQKIFSYHCCSASSLFLDSFVIRYGLQWSSVSPPLPGQNNASAEFSHIMAEENPS